MKNCLTCGKVLVLKKARDLTRKKFCSHSCCCKHTQKKHPELRENLKLGRTKQVREKAAETVKKRMALGLIPKPPKSTKESRRKAGLKMRGKNHPKWVSDRTKLKARRKDSSFRPLMNTWRKDIFERDHYTCQISGIKGGKLVGHHIDNWSQYPGKRYLLSNGICISEEVHKDFHKIYGRKTTRKDLNKYMEVLK